MKLYINQHYLQYINISHYCITHIIWW